MRDDLAGYRRPIAALAAMTALAALVVWTAASIDLKALWRLLLSARSSELLVEGSALVLAVWFLRALRWRMALRAMGWRPTLFWTYLSTGAALGLGAITPAQSGELIKIAHLKAELDADPARASAGFAVERICDVIVLAALTILAAGGAAVGADMRLLSGFVIAGSVVIAVGFVSLSRLGRSPPFLRAFLSGAEELLRLPGLMIRLVLLTVASWLVTAVLWQTMLASIDIHVSFPIAILLIGTVTLAVILSFIPSGLVISEATIVALLTQRGFDPEQALAGALILRVITLQAGVLGLLHWVALRRFRHA